MVPVAWAGFLISKMKFAVFAGSVDGLKSMA
jgi:hypothetical protein